YVWRAKSSRTLSRRFSDYLSVILVGPVLVFSAIGMTASLMSSSLMQRIMGIEPFGSLLAGIAALLPFALILMAFTFVYMFVPNTRVKFSDRKSTRLNSSHVKISYAVFCLKKKTSGPRAPPQGSGGAVFPS